MDELGHILREARENKGHTLGEVQEKIRINTRFLEALEAGRYSDLPTPVHVRGFLRNYARFLGLDPEPLLERYKLSENYLPSPVADETRTDISQLSPLPERQDQPFFDPVNVEVSQKRRGPEAGIQLLIIAAAIIALGLILNRFLPLILNNEDGSEALTESITDVLQNITGNEESTDVDIQATVNATLTVSEIITSTNRTSQNIDTPPTPSPTRPPLPATLEEINLKIEITERTFMEVTIDGDTIFSGLARDGDAFEWLAEEEAKISTGNAIAIFLTINDTPLGRMGGRGENKEEIFRTTQ